MIISLLGALMIPAAIFLMSLNMIDIFRRINKPSSAKDSFLEHIETTALSHNITFSNLAHEKPEQFYNIRTIEMAEADLMDELKSRSKQGDLR